MSIDINRHKQNPTDMFKNQKDIGLFNKHFILQN